MARKKVEVVECSRCDRVEHREEMNEQRAYACVLAVQLHPNDLGGSGLDVRFEDLCGPCMRTVRALLDQVGKRIEGVSPDRAAKTASSTATSSPPTAPIEAKKQGPAPAGPAPGPHAVKKVAEVR